MRRESSEMAAVSGFVDQPLTDLPHGVLRDAFEASINLVENTTRGLLAEVIVAVAVGGTVTPGWDPWDVDTPEGIRIEVKTTGTVQSWPQAQRHSPSWNIAPRGAWERTDRGYIWSDETKRRADVYVLAIHDGTRPADLEEWNFRVVSRARMDRVMPTQRTVRPSSVDTKLSPVILQGTGGLREAILAENRW